MSQVDYAMGEPGGPIAYMANNRVAANLFMLGILAAGIVSLTGLEREAWPTVPFNTIEVSMAYPGATPDEVEESIVVKIEEEVSSLEEVKSVKSVAAPGMASVRVEVKSGTDIARALEDIKSAVGRIQSFPGGAERADFHEMTNRQSIIRLIVHGAIPERSLKELAYQIEDEIASLASVSRVETTGVRNYEVSIEVPLNRLRALGLTLDDVASAVRRGSLDLSAGSIDTQDAQVRVRTLGQRYDQQDFEDVVLLSRSDGTVVRLGDIAEVHDDFQDTDLIVRHQGQPGVFVEVYRSEGEQVMDVATAVQEHLDSIILPGLPKGVGVTVWNDESQVYSERIDLLLKNGLLGLLLVFISLALFLEIRLALWVVVGLVTSGIGALAVMLLLDIAINTISLFAFVLAIGIIVDDAIVVAEHVHLERKRGTPGVAAAIRGVRRIKKPLTFAVLTSVAAFVPLLFIPGGIGEIWGALPIVIIAMLFISLAESLLILPNHLTHLHGPEWVPANPVDRFFAGTQERVDRAFNQFVTGPLDTALRFATAQPAVIVAGAIGLLVVSASLLPAGIIKTTLADVVEGDFINAHLEMPDGTPAHRTFDVAMELEAAGQRVLERLSRERGEGAPPLLSGVTVTVGQAPRVEGGGLVPSPTLNPQANVATVEFKLLGAQERNMSTIDIVQAWREEVGVLPYVRGIAYSGEVIDLGNPVEAVLSHPDPEQLVAIATSVVNGLQSVGGIFDVLSDHTPGVREIQLALRPEARTLGLTFGGHGAAGACRLLRRRGRSSAAGTGRSPRLRSLAGHGAQRHHRHRGLPGPHADGGRSAAQPGRLADDGHVASGDSAPRQPAGGDRHRRRPHRGHLRRRRQRIPRGLDPRPPRRREPRLELLVRRRAATADRVSRRPLPRLRTRHADDLCVAGHSPALLPQAVHHHGDHSIRPDRRHPRSPDPWHLHERRIFHGFLRIERRRRERLPGHDRLHRTATKGRRVPANRDHRRCQGAVPSNHADIGHHLPRLHATHFGDGHPGPVPSSLRGLARDRGPAHHYVADGADPGAHGDLPAGELAARSESRG